MVRIPSVPASEKRIPLVFFRTDSGSEPVREWLLELPKADRRVVGLGLKQLEFAWPVGMPLCRALFELRVALPSRRIARVLVCCYLSGHPKTAGPSLEGLVNYGLQPVNSGLH